MKLLFVSVLLTLLTFSDPALAEKPISSAQLEKRNPVFSPSEVVSLARDFLQKEKHLNMNDYKLDSLSFSYFSPFEKPNRPFTGEWVVGFTLAARSPRPGDDLLVVISNSRTPVIKQLPSL